jgi:hypothetical protein
MYVHSLGRDRYQFKHVVEDWGWAANLISSPQQGVLGKRLLGRPRSRWEDNIRMDLKSIGRLWTGLIWPKIGTSGKGQG